MAKAQWLYLKIVEQCQVTADLQTKTTDSDCAFAIMYIHHW